jgi:hypothetical protein
METSRRDFVHHMTAGALGLSALHRLGFQPAADLEAAAPQGAPTFDVGWPARLKGKYKAVFDCTEPESGYGVWRMAAWTMQMAEVLKAKPEDVCGVIILRHLAIPLAMQQSFWDKYYLGQSQHMMHPLTGDPTDKNPVLLDEKDGIPAPFNMAAMPKQMARGVTVLACNLALEGMAEIVQRADGVDQAEAHKRAVAGLVPGVILQPSGVFAAVLAGQAGCAYVKAS